MKKLTLTCKKATYLLSLKEEEKLSLPQQIQLKAHLAICSLCRLFEKQSELIAKNAPHIHTHQPSQLSASSKEKMHKKVNELIIEEK